MMRKRLQIFVIFCDLIWHKITNWRVVQNASIAEFWHEAIRQEKFFRELEFYIAPNQEDEW